MSGRLTPAGGQQQGVTAAQFRSFAQRMPSYYVSVVAMMLGVTLVFHSLAPAWLAYGIPLSITVLGIWRGLWWVRHRNDPVTDEQAGKYLRKSTAVLLTCVLIVIGMDVRLFFYGDIYGRFFLLIQILCSATCGFYCLMHLRRAAFASLAILMIPCAGLTLQLGHLGTTVAAFTSLMTAGVIMAAMRGYERDFFLLIKAKAETSELSRENLRLAHLDMLTGLPNRRYFFDRIETCLAPGQDEEYLPTVGIVDLDGFKPVNDSFGHRVGDRVLEVIAGRLERLDPSMKHVCRLGGDEFVFLTPETEPGRLEALGQAIASAVRETVQLEQRTIRVGCSVGFAVRKAGDAVLDGMALFEQADYALYHAKRNGRARTVLFSEEHELLIKEQGMLEQSLRRAEIDSEFHLVYQPIVDVMSLEVTAFECLARWTSPVLGEVSPGHFISVAEQAGLIHELTRVLLRKGLAAAQTWPQHIHVSFNVSPHEIASLEQTRTIIEIIGESGIAPNRVAIELTETALLHNFAEVSRHMAMIRETGAAIYLDDFGTGHSSLSYIHTLPLDKIKLDRSFVQSLASNQASQSIIRAVVALCRDLQVACVVEGVETAMQLEHLRTLKAEQIQGYLLARPMPGSAVLEYLHTSRPLDSPVARAGVVSVETAASSRPVVFPVPPPAPTQGTPSMPHA